MLFVPVIDGALPVEGKWWVTGEHIPHFEPVCRRCSAGFILHIICSAHRLPLLVDKASCRLCLKHSASTSATAR